jgi:hypothetical protein
MKQAAPSAWPENWPPRWILAAATKPPRKHSKPPAATLATNRSDELQPLPCPELRHRQRSDRSGVQKPGEAAPVRQRHEMEPQRSTDGSDLAYPFAVHITLDLTVDPTSTKMACLMTDLHLLNGTPESTGLWIWNLALGSDLQGNCGSFSRRTL